MAFSSLFDIFLQGIPHSTPPTEISASLDRIAHPIRTEDNGIMPLENGRDWLVYIGGGATKLIANASGGREQIVAFHFGGDLLSIPADASHSYSLWALSRTEALAFPTAEFLRRTRMEPAFDNILLSRSLTALHRCRDKAVGLGRKNAEERLASFLVGMAERIGKAAGRHCTLDLPMSRRDIGDSLGLTIETISRQFSNLRKAGLIETQGRSRVILRAPAQLAMRAGHI